LGLEDEERQRRFEEAPGPLGLAVHVGFHDLDEDLGEGEPRHRPVRAGLELLDESRPAKSAVDT
jgi:hypothetical protein